MAGGTRITLDEFGLTSLVLMTGEPIVVSTMRRQAERVGRRAAQLQRDLAAAKLQAVEHVHRQLSSRTAGPSSVAWLGAARQGISEARRRWRQETTRPLIATPNGRCAR